MSEWDDIEALAAEYVLGTLDADERAMVASRRVAEPRLDRAIADWERRLAPLAESIAPVVPPLDILPGIERRLDALVAAPVPSTASAGVVDLLEARVRRWRRIGIAASALAAGLALVIGLRETVWSPRQVSYVAVFQKDDQLPDFLLTIDLQSRQLTVRPVGAARQPGRTYQLWIASDQLGPDPRSLGLIGDGSAEARTALTAYQPALLQRATFGVSLEPAGGSPTGRPTSPALHAKLYPAAP